MALPLIGLYALIALVGFLFLLGVSRYNLNASLGFIAFASVLMMVSGMFIVNEGVQLDTVDSINAETLEYNYQIVSYDVNSYNWLRVIADTFIFGGAVGIIFGFAYNFKRSKSRNVDEWAI